ncbi:hypothetical protein [Pantoea sp. BAV 3049]|uniref:hypothetical protein n=1 Tax=Pantoea sp. BAV 3049 TaxID=2654188 RepID=UPI00131C2E32|nr:hypothetical protein [Pantoea sp. BAV 3049]
MKNRIVLFITFSIFLSGMPAWAVNLSTGESQEVNAFFNNTHLDLSLRNHWKYLKENEAQPTTVHNAWGQAANVNLQSGYLWNVIGFDATYTRAVRLGASDYFSTRGLLYNQGEGMDKKNAHGFSKFGQRYVKVKLGDQTLGMQAKAGWQALKNFGVLTLTNRLSRNSYSGYSGTFNWQDLRLDAAYVTRAIRHDSPENLHLQTNDKRNIESIFTSGVFYKGLDGQFAYGYGEAKDYLRRQLIETGYQLAPEWRISSQIYGSQALEKYKSMAASKREFDHDAWHYVGEARWQNNGWTQRMALAWTSAAKKNAVGYYARPITKNTRGRFNAMTSAGKDYMRDKELAIVSYTEYEITKGLASGIQLNYGQFNYKNNTVRSGEVAWLNRWQPSHPSLKNLSVAAQLGYGWSYKNNKETPLLNAQGKYMRSPSLSSEVTIDYKFGLFN